jgi:hypothetical protein
VRRIENNLFRLVMFAGPYAVIFYSVDIFTDHLSFDKHIAAILVATIGAVGGVLAIFLVKRVPRQVCNHD